MKRYPTRPGGGSALMVLLMLLLQAGCGDAGAPAVDTGARTSPSGMSYPYKIVTTTGMVTDIVRNVAGDKAGVDGLLGEGVDPHLYKPTISDVTKVLEADVILYSGLMLEGRMADTFVKAARQGKPVYAVTEMIDTSFLLEPPEFAGQWDPHVWMDVSAWSLCVDEAGRALSEADPPNAAYYRANVATYRARLVALHEYAKQVIATVPDQQRVLITAHDAFNYFGRAYGIEVRGIQGLSTDSQAGLKDINGLVDYIVARQVQAVFVETSVSAKNVEALIEGAAARGHRVRIGGTLFSDAMGPQGTYEGTYIGMLDHNATIIARALGGEAPALGMDGKLAPARH